jgi:hypothetical protein
LYRCPLGHDIAKLTPVDIFSDLADEGGFMPEVLQHGKHVARRAAGVGFPKGIALRADAAFGKVDQQLAERDDIILFHVLSPKANRTLQH